MSEKKRSAKEFFMDNNKKNLKIFIIVVVAILVLAAVTMGIYVFAKVGLINIDKDGKVDPDYTLASKLKERKSPSRWKLMKGKP